MFHANTSLIFMLYVKKKIYKKQHALFSFRENGFSDVFLLEFLVSLKIVNLSSVFSPKFGTQSSLSFSAIFFCNAYHRVLVCCAEIKKPGTTPLKMVSQTKSSKNLLPLILTYWHTINSVRSIAPWLTSKWDMAWWYWADIGQWQKDKANDHYWWKEERCQ